MAKWDITKVKCPRCDEHDAAFMNLHREYERRGKELGKSEEREATLNDRVTMLEEHLCLTEEKLSKCEALLAKAVEAMQFYADPTYNGYDVCVGDYGLSLTTGCVINDAGDLARTTLAELTGGKDE